LYYLVEAGKYWTSGTNAGTTSLDVFGWCSSGKLFDTTQNLWGKIGYPENPKNISCVAIYFDDVNLNLSGLRDFSCNLTLSTICEYSK